MRPLITDVGPGLKTQYMIYHEKFMRSSLDMASGTPWHPGHGMKVLETIAQAGKNLLGREKTCHSETK